ncbi:ABC transporter ATP-binding protein [Ornithobacterium rhinotracheale]|uniref:ABC transporter ATP-binding protein n=1 Tax=Ornithobacterium rhinotracheale TaxID=28251 RepID=A0A3R5UT77_ORNRH|nr:ABC transporter ATP-binding protein [Ornithobacterium rhinotracheale]QAR29938.1 ABC transporter ATP-binding protein [Ornithobacterium rhinotracheale]
MKELLSLNKYLYKYRGRLFLGTLFIIGLNFFMVYKIRYVGKAVNFIKASLNSGETEQISQLWYYGALIILLPLVAVLLQFLMRQTIIVASRHMEYDLKNVIYEHYQELDTAFYKNNRIGDLMNRISEDVGYVRMYLGPGIMYPINLLAMSVILVVEMLSIDKTMTFFTLLPLPFLSVLVYFLSSKINRKSRELQAEQSNLSAFVQDMFSGIRVIKSFSKEKSVKAKYVQNVKKYKYKAIELANIDAFFSPLVVVIIGVSQIVILYVGGMRYINGQIHEIGTLAQFFMYLNMLIWPFTSLGWVSMVVQRASSSMKRINEFLNTDPMVKNTGVIKAKIQGKISFERVNFTYENTGIQALKNVSFEVPAGETLAILGKTGSGKTTIAELISRLYDPTSGVVKIDDRDLKMYDLFALRDQIGVVPQEAFLFSTSLRENLNFGADQDSLELAQEYAQKADLHENIACFREGYDTVVGERGVTLSGGQKQRLSISRALIKKPKILIFDDSLSAVDTETETKILNNIKQESEGKTTIIITHRVSSAKHAHQIIVLDSGEIIERGTHQDLMDLGGIYSEMYTQQTQMQE